MEEENVEEQEETVLTLADVYFNHRSLEEYEEEFSQKLPAIPCSSDEILRAISCIANSYQVAYNCSSRLLVTYAKAEKDYKVKRNELINNKISTLRDAGAKGKLPSKETIEAMVMAESDELESLINSLKKWEMMKGWFDSHVKKLDRMMMSAKDISFGVNNVERIYARGNV